MGETKTQQKTEKTQQKADASRAASEGPIELTVRAFNLMTRLLNRVAEHPVFKGQGIGLTEWSFMHALIEQPDQASGQVAARLGITAQRNSQVVAGLAKLGHITVKAAAGDSRKKSFTVTPKGAELVRAIDGKVLELVNEAFVKNPNGLIGLVRHLRSLVKVVTPASKA